MLNDCSIYRWKLKACFCEFQLEQIRVGHDGSGKNKQWFLEEVIVYVIERNERYIFKCNQWIGGKNAHCDLSVGMYVCMYVCTYVCI